MFRLLAKRKQATALLIFVHNLEYSLDMVVRFFIQKGVVGGHTRRGCVLVIVEPGIFVELVGPCVARPFSQKNCRAAGRGRVTESFIICDY